MTNEAVPHLRQASPDGLIDRLARAAGSSLRVVLHFGSTLTRASPGVASAHDLFAVVDDYATFYEGAGDEFGLGRSPRLLAALNRRLPPNIVFLRDLDGPGAKVFVISERDLRRALSAHPRDHFCRGRMLQRMRVAFSRDDVSRDRVTALLRKNREFAVQWMRPYFDRPFTAEEFCERLVEISYRGEIRPESGDRAHEVFAAQRVFLRGEYEQLLGESADLDRVGSSFQYRRSASGTERLRSRAGFALSKLRATARWAKYIVTFDGWLDYIVAKVRRRTGLIIELTPHQRRWPLIFLWPTFVRVLRARRNAPKDPGF